MQRRRLGIVGALVLALGVLLASSLSPAARVPRRLAAAQACRASALTASERRLRTGAVGETHAVTLTNRGPAACRLAGVPRLAIGRGQRAPYVWPQVTADHEPGLILPPAGRASFWVDLLAPEGNPVPGAQTLRIAGAGLRGTVGLPLPAAYRAAQQVIVSALVPGELSSLPASARLAPPCASRALSAGSRPLDVAAGAGYELLVLRNHGRRSCSLGGRPQLSVSRRGAVSYTIPTRASGPAARVDIAAGARASLWTAFSPGVCDQPAFSAPPQPGRELIRLGAFTRPLSVAGRYPPRWPRRCVESESAVVAGVMRMAPGFTAAP